MGEVQIPLRSKYLTAGVVKKSAVPGNGVSGKHKRRKATQKEKDIQNARQRRRVMFVGPSGKRRMMDCET